MMTRIGPKAQGKNIKCVVVTGESSYGELCALAGCEVAWRPLALR